MQISDSNESGGIKKRLATGAAWLTASRVVINLMGFASTIILARLLTPDDFGLVAIAAALLAVVMSLTELSLSSALVQHRDPSMDHFHSAWTIGFIRAAVITLIFAVAAYPISYIYKDSRLISVVLVMGLTGAMSGLTNPKTTLLAKQLVFWPEFVVRVSQKVLILVISIPIAYYYHSYWSIVLGSVFGTLLSVGMSYAIVPYLPRFRLTHFKELFSFSVWLSLGQAVNTLNWRFDQFLIGYFVGKPELGVYSVADNLSALPTREATAPLAQTLFPGFVRMVTDRSRLSRGYLLAQSTLCAVAFPLGFGLAISAEPTIRLVMGEKWLAAVPIIQVLAGTFALQTLTTAAQPLAMAMGHTRLLFRRDLQMFLVRIPFVIVGLWAGGLLGVVYARFLNSLVGITVNMLLVRRIAGISVGDQLGTNLRSLFAVTSMVVVSVVGQWVVGFGIERIQLIAHLCFAIFVGGSVYVITLVLTWLIRGKPAGPESEILKILLRLRTRVAGV